MASRNSYNINPLAMELAYTSRTVIDSAINKIIEQFKDSFCKNLFNQACKYLDDSQDTSRCALVYKNEFLYINSPDRFGSKSLINLPLELWEQGEFALGIINGLHKLSKKISQSISEYSAKGKALIVYKTELLKSLPLRMPEFEMEYEQEEIDALNEKFQPLLDQLNYYRTFLLL